MKGAKTNTRYSVLSNNIELLSNIIEKNKCFHLIVFSFQKTAISEMCWFLRIGNDVEDLNHLKRTDIKNGWETWPYFCKKAQEPRTLP